MGNVQLPEYFVMKSISVSVTTISQVRKEPTHDMVIFMKMEWFLEWKGTIISALSTGECLGFIVITTSKTPFFLFFFSC